MTINYPVVELDTKPIPPRPISRPQEDREKEAEEKGLKLYEISWTDGYVESIKTSVSWVSHGNYAITQPKLNAKDDEFFPWIYMELEIEFFDQIIEAFESGEIVEPKNSDDNFDAYYKPFWTGDVPLRGMQLMPSRLSAYYYHRKKEAFILHDQSYNLYDGTPSHHIKSMGITIEDFKKLRDLVFESKAEKPVHYCKIGW